MCENGDESQLTGPRGRGERAVWLGGRQVHVDGGKGQIQGAERTAEWGKHRACGRPTQSPYRGSVPGERLLQALLQRRLPVEADLPLFILWWNPLPLNLSGPVTKPCGESEFVWLRGWDMRSLRAPMRRSRKMCTALKLPCPEDARAGHTERPCEKRTMPSQPS